MARLSELLAHEPGCAGLCTAAASVRPQGVWWVVRKRVGSLGPAQKGRRASPQAAGGTGTARDGLEPRRPG